MPAAEPAPTGDDVAGPPGTGDARIIHLAPHRTHGRNGAAAAHRTADHRGGTDMTQPAQPGPDGSSDEAILRPLAEMLERSYLERHMSLTDPRVAEAFDVAMDIASTMMGGAHAQGIVDEAQRIELAGLIEGARRAAALAGE